MSTRSRTDATRARRNLLKTAGLAAAGGLVFDRLANATDATSKHFERKAVHAEGAPAADIGYSPALLARGQQGLMISGQGPKDRTADMETQIRQTFDKIGLLLKAAGASFENVFFMPSFWVYLQRYLKTLRRVWRISLVEPCPASPPIATTERASPALQLEIEVVALR